MKNYIKGAALAAMMVLSLASCRKESDTVHNFSYYDDLVWEKAKTSYGEKFKILWEGLNSNYAIWDYEKQFGLDWDDVYAKYYPEFVELDTLSMTRTIKDDELTNLLKEVLDPLHDGHIGIQVYNHMTKNYLRISPNADRNMNDRQDDYMEAYVGNSPLMPNLAYYQGISGKLKEYKTVDASSSSQIKGVLDSLKIWSNLILMETSKKTILTEEELNNEKTAKTIEYEIDQLTKLKTDAQIIEGVNSLAQKYGYLGLNGVHVLDKDLLEAGITMTYALFEGNIAYLYFDSFSITPYLITFETDRSKLQPYAQLLAVKVADIWYSWFNAIQELHNAGQLGGVIIDVRGNGGGMVSDYQFALGALLPSGGLHVMDSRMKRGIGRYDYSPLVPQIMQTLEQPHVTVTEPIVVLANLRSVSMAEMTSMGAHVVENARLVGTRTWGGLCGLVGNESYNYTYAGHIGIKDKTPVYVYCPCVASFTKDGELLEGVGVTPDIEVHMDKNIWNFGKGPDQQLDRAIQYITSGK